MDRDLVIARLGFGADAVPYLEALELQRKLHERRVRGEIPDICLQHMIAVMLVDKTASFK